MEDSRKNTWHRRYESTGLGKRPRQLVPDWDSGKRGLEP